VPSATFDPTFTFKVKVALPPFANRALVIVTGPVEPAAGVVADHPAGVLERDEGGSVWQGVADGHVLGIQRSVVSNIQGSRSAWFRR
jgi:hypothetical protein